jgi:hypothetical protein
MEYKTLYKDYKFDGEVAPYQSWNEFIDFDDEAKALEGALCAYREKADKFALKNLTTHWGFWGLEISPSYDGAPCMEIPYEDFLNAMVEKSHEYIEYDDTMENLDAYIEDTEKTLKTLKALKQWKKK